MTYWTNRLGYLMAGGERGPQKLLSAYKRKKIIELRQKRWSFQQIADELGLSYSAVYKHYQEVCKAIPAPELEQHRKEMLAQLDEAEKVVLQVLYGKSYKVSASGKIVVFGGKPVLDPDTKLKAAATLVRIQERKSRLLGADAEQKVKSDVRVNYTVKGITKEDLT